MLDFIRDIFASFRQTSLERIKSPFLGAFVFSWLGFNWQMLAILFLSNSEIERRLIVINESFGIGSFLLGPICTTALIVIIFPQMNKLITRIQDKPNTDTISLGLNSKIRIANLQQELAESEARKKLADKKEERYIEDGIALIKETNERYEIVIEENDIKINTLTRESNDLTRQLAKIESKLKVESESKKEIHNELIIERDNNRLLGNQIQSLHTDKNKLINDLDTYESLYDKLNDDNEDLRLKYIKIEKSIKLLATIYPYIVDISDEDESPVLRVREFATHALFRLNKDFMEKMGKESANHDNS